jgi:GNAT superfamily N-acetyltransferase
MVRRAMGHIRACRADEREAILAIVNAAAEAYRGVIPADRWHDPYMSREELDGEIAAGVRFWGHESDGALTGVMGIQGVGDVDLIRHAYVLPARQGEGIGTYLLRHLRELSGRPMLVGTWADAGWAIRFYERNGFAPVSEPEKNELLRRYWTIPDRQIETSVVLAERRGQTPNESVTEVQRPPCGV